MNGKILVCALVILLLVIISVDSKKDKEEKKEKKEKREKKEKKGHENAVDRFKDKVGKRNAKIIRKLQEKWDKLAAKADEAKNHPDRFSTKKSKAARGVAKFLGQVEGAKRLIESYEFLTEVLKVLMEDGELKEDERQELITQGSLARILPEGGENVDCPYDKNIECDETALYRELDGTCNNLINPLWGSALTPFTRMKKPAAYSNGLDTPRQYGIDKSELKGARNISLHLSAAEEDARHPCAALMHMSLGQVLDHDCDRTALSMLMATDGSNENVVCGSDGCAESEPGRDTENCFPIPVDSEDPVFGEDRSCLSFTRSAGVMSLGCDNAVREQLNQITSALDASFLYGSNIDDLRKVAGGEPGSTLDQMFPDKGTLLTTAHPFNADAKPLLPQNPYDKMCNSGNNENVKCFISGDARTNEQTGLASLHTVFVREHNRIAEELHALHQGWSGLRVFQETRRIVIAEWQAIVFKEYLPVIFGTQGYKEYIGEYNGYDETVNPSVFNVFAAAAFRVAHSMIPNDLLYTSLNYSQHVNDDFANIFFTPGTLYEVNMFYEGSGEHGVDCTIRANLYQAAQDTDSAFSASVHENLFAPKGTDLYALNIQRGRDHGLPGYMEWREACDLSTATEFDQMEDISYERTVLLSDVYASPEDIDLYVGLISENHVLGGVVGPTTACLQGRQFSNMRNGDRFFYKNTNQPHAFDDSQLAEIDKATLARILCDNLDKMDTVQANVNLRPKDDVMDDLKLKDDEYQAAWLLHYDKDDNARRPCNEFPSMDLAILTSE